MSVILRWLARKWTPQEPEELLRAYRIVFGSADGQRLLQHWLDNVYCTVYEGQSAEAHWVHTGRRSFVQEILTNLDLAESPEKYRVRTEA